MSDRGRTLTQPGVGARPLRVVGVDPGLANLGLGAVQEAGKEAGFLGGALVSTSPRSSQGERLVVIRRELSAFLDRYRPDAIALEGQFLKHQRQTSFRVGQAVGVVLLTAAERDLPVFEYGPDQVKLALVGSGRADKDQVAFMVRALLKLTAEKRPDHVTDALALALTHLQSRRIGALAALAERQP
ncbi:MAG: crossover junction endodeoxyribonuclease RuvC [Trueperaceae bacterium]|nr:crossover junction endodeoxyribonuclease RuvC [Trueperaceae bacterium]MCC6311210.1 crossover junction endodeoxyribonuclease RuvC [Trueperaceae bacterium]MCO5172968.1 crossover junction endodeoxyribonuclease RuvC [Trueperaceae bacterium]